jgi:hypothetical protein
MKALLQQTVDLLKKRVRENLETINNNQMWLNEMFSQPFSSERTFQIEKKYAENRTLLAENNDLISLQLTLSNFLKKYQEKLMYWEEEDEGFIEADLAAYLNEDELFELTIEGKLGYETGHPKFDDEAFFKKLLSYYASIEAYEKCNALLSHKRKNQVR